MSRTIGVCVDARMVASRTWTTDGFGLVAFQVTLPASQAARASAQTSSSWFAFSGSGGFLRRIVG